MHYWFADHERIANSLEGRGGTEGVRDYRALVGIVGVPSSLTPECSGFAVTIATSLDKNIRLRDRHEDTDWGRRRQR